MADSLFSRAAPLIGNVEDRRNEPKNGYNAMRANLNNVGSFVRHVYPFLRNFDLPSIAATPPPPASMAPLSGQAGYGDIPQQTVPWGERLAKDLDYTFYGMEGSPTKLFSKDKK